MSLKEKINADFITAFKAKDALRKDALGMLKSKITETEKKAGTVATDDDVMAAVQSLVKQRQQTIDTYQQTIDRGGSPDNMIPAIEKEKKEIEILQAYLPQQMTREEMRAEVLEVLKDMIFPAEQRNAAVGGIMKYFKTHYNGRYNPKELKEIIDSIG